MLQKILYFDDNSHEIVTDFMTVFVCCSLKYLHNTTCRKTLAKNSIYSKMKMVCCENRGIM